LPRSPPILVAKLSRDIFFRDASNRTDIAAVAIAIPADGNGLTPGKGAAAAGKLVYENTCSPGHGANMQGIAGLQDMPSGPALRLIG
jgi:cytochrome c5